ncbi:MAG TPA: ABC transporter permease [Thermoplasmata archaeon]|nr:ABC transporter permease [Thermoplasmata archaeon]
MANGPLSQVALQVPPSTVQIPKLARFQLHEYVRSRRFIALVAIIAVIGAILTTVIAYYRAQLTSGGLLSGGLAFYGSFWGGGVDLVIVLSAVFFGGDAIAGEFQNKTGYFLMGLPIRRTTVYVGKFIAAYLASVAIMLLYLAILIGNGAYYLHGGFLPWQLGISLLLALTYLAAVMGATFLFSSLFKTSAYGFVLTAILFLFGFTLIEDLITGLTSLEPWMVISYAESTIGNVFASHVNWGFGATTSLSFGRMRTFNPGIGEGLVIMLGYFFLTAAAGLALFEREEFS